MSECKYCDNIYTRKEVFGMTEVLKSENTKLKAERDKWKTDHELLVDDYKQILIDLNKKDAENKRLREALEEIQATDNFLEIWDIAKEALKEKQNG